MANSLSSTGDKKMDRKINDVYEKFGYEDGQQILMLMAFQKVGEILGFRNRGKI